jgi:hypothetical protein
VYYGTEQLLHGHGSDPAVREALWGGPGFNQGSKFFGEIRRVAQVRAAQAALRYGRFYFRPVSGDGRRFAVSDLTPGVVAFSRILNDQEVLVAANISTSQQTALDVIVEIQLSSQCDRFQVLYSNQAMPTPPQPVRQPPSSPLPCRKWMARPVSGPYTLCASRCVRSRCRFFGTRVELSRDSTHSVARATS